MKQLILVIGDLMILTLVVLTGFASHGEFSAASLPRMAATLLPLWLAWFLLAFWLGLFQETIVGTVKELWRPAFVMLFAGPLATTLRGLLLDAPVMPIFTVVLSGTAAVGLTLWRLLWWALRGRRKQFEGRN